MEVELAAGDARVRIDAERGGRVASFSVDGLELLVNAADGPLEWGCFVMAPFAGRVRDGRFRYAGHEHQLTRNDPPHAIHGTVYDLPWKVEHADATDAVLVSDLGAWPFPGRVVHRVRLREDTLELRLEIWAEDEPFPASCGWHPWFRRRLARGEPVAIDLAAGALWERHDQIPTGDLVAPTSGPWDDCFTELAQAPVLRWDGALELTVDSTCMDVVIYDEPNHAVCVEPQTGPPDALRLTPVVVEPGLPLIAEADLRWKA
jgi:aldose 1-epimerase